MMKKIPLLGLALFCVAASAQPTSFGGITPGKTTPEELNSLAKEVTVDGSTFIILLKQPEGKRIAAKALGQVVYRLTVPLDDSPELKLALIEKYGQPNMKVGEIQKVTCQNGLGVTTERFEKGMEEELRWPAKDNVQGALVSLAREECAESLSEVYTLSHIPTVSALDSIREKLKQMKAEEKRRKPGNAY
jgi:hypothetical protein